ncbi:YdbL family protein [Shewanella cyperi]|uniref:YdbL family protein n=1 Tax=Shewanella cyperi TaxID=2814292 RepID=A0A975ALF5_9GAMM|nr:YdbL family protein [Shewanella cyperi]QSX31392.1 YdbL family protein [Shewanella cyperi]
MMKKLLLLLVSALLAFQAMAMDLHQAKSMGYLGEQNDGYLGLVKANDEARAIMDEVNAKRRAHYQKIAAQNQISTEDVAKLAAEKAIRAADKGEWIQDAKGNWLRK